METKQNLGIVFACMGLLFASGANWAGGLLAIVCFGVAVVCLNDREEAVKNEELRMKKQSSTAEGKVNEESVGSHQTAA